MKRASERAEEAASGIPPELGVVWRAERRRWRRLGGGEQLEAFMQWVHDHPAEVAEYQAAGAEDALDDMLAERAVLEDAAQAAEDAENPAMMPEQKPGRSEQRVGTPRGYLDWVAARFGGPLTWDLAANEANTVVQSPRFYGPGSPSGSDGLAEPWSVCGPRLWLNPPYADIAPWVMRAAGGAAAPGALVLVLVPASVGSVWWRLHVHGRARVHFGRRIRFVGHKSAYPKDLALCVYGAPPDYVCVDWPAA